MYKSILATLALICGMYTSPLSATEDWSGSDAFAIDAFCGTEPEIFYIDGFCGVNVLRIPESDEGKIDADVGYAIGASVGYCMSNAIRAECEMTYRDNSVNRITLYDIIEEYGVSVPIHGQLRTCAFMGNLLIDFPSRVLVAPYIGGGVGARIDRGETEMDVLDRQSGQINRYLTKIKDESFAYQGIAGLRFCASSKSNMKLEYRILATEREGSSGDHTLALAFQRKF